MRGLDRTTGSSIAGFDHLVQSVADILTTRVGSRVMRRDYGSEVPALIDAPINRDTLIDTFAAIALAIDTWEPRLDLTAVTVEEAEAGRLQVKLEGHYFFDWPSPQSRFVELVL